MANLFSAWARRTARGRGCSLCSWWPGRASSSWPPRPTVPRRPTLDLGLSTPWPSPPLSRRRPPATRAASSWALGSALSGTGFFFPQAWRGWGLLSGTSLMDSGVFGDVSEEEGVRNIVIRKVRELPTSSQCTGIVIGQVQREKSKLEVSKSCCILYIRD